MRNQGGSVKSKLYHLALVLINTSLFTSSYAAQPNTSNPSTFLGPTARLSYTSTMSDASAYSVAGELGWKNLRVGGTLGWKFDENQLFKLTADYLSQNITYSFFSDTTDQWMQQISFGGAYEYGFPSAAFMPQLDMNGYFSYAPSKTLSNRSGVFIMNSIPLVFIEQRRIAGSSAFGIAPGFSVSPWNNSRIGLIFNYDNVYYNENSFGPTQDAQGLGLTLTYKQQLWHDLNLDLAAGMRQPFNDYKANIAWQPQQSAWSVGLFGDYLKGKNTLPTTWNLGIDANYQVDKRAPVIMSRAKRHDLKNEMTFARKDNLLNWTSEPAVYLPQVLAIADSRTLIDCLDGRVIFSGSILSLASNSGSFNLAGNFSGRNLIYTVTTNRPLTPGDTITIDPAGNFTYTFANDPPYFVTVLARNSCNLAYSNTFLLGTALD